MVGSCAARGCTSRQMKGSGLSFHRFPLSNPPLLKKWIEQVGRKNFKPTKCSLLCGKHFSKDCYFSNPVWMQRRLKNTAVPAPSKFFLIEFSVDTNIDTSTSSSQTESQTKLQKKGRVGRRGRLETSNGFAPEVDESGATHPDSSQENSQPCVKSASKRPKKVWPLMEAGVSEDDQESTDLVRDAAYNLKASTSGPSVSNKQPRRSPRRRKTMWPDPEDEDVRIVEEVYYLDSSAGAATSEGELGDMQKWKVDTVLLECIDTDSKQLTNLQGTETVEKTSAGTGKNIKRSHMSDSSTPIVDYPESTSFNDSHENDTSRIKGASEHLESPPEEPRIPGDSQESADSVHDAFSDLEIPGSSDSEEQPQMSPQRKMTKLASLEDDDGIEVMKGRNLPDESSGATTPDRELEERRNWTVDEVMQENDGMKKQIKVLYQTIRRQNVKIRRLDQRLKMGHHVQKGRPAVFEFYIKQT